MPFWTEVEPDGADRQETYDARKSKKSSGFRAARSCSRRTWSTNWTEFRKQVEVW